jgi:hypothetical protein
MAVLTLQTKYQYGNPSKEIHHKILNLTVDKKSRIISVGYL